MDSDHDDSRGFACHKVFILISSHDLRLTALANVAHYSRMDHDKVINCTDMCGHANIRRRVVRAPMPPGYVNQIRCPRCRGNDVAAAIVYLIDGRKAVPGADEDDPNLVCLREGCQAWWD